MRITLFTDTLAAGGAERTVVVLAEEFANRGHRVVVVTWNNDVADFYMLPTGVQRIRVPLDSQQASVRWFDVIGNARRLRAIRRTIRATDPDAVISFQDGTNELFLVSSAGDRYRKLISCQNDIEQHAHYNRRWAALRRYLYRLADWVVFLDADQARRASHSHRSWRCTGIPNPLPHIDTSPGTRETQVTGWLERFSLRVSAMGRLVYQKGFDLLLEAFKRVNEVLPNAGLVIIGEGDLRPQLEASVAGLGLKDVVMMPGRLHRPHAVISRCHAFVLSSRYEGQGLALVEAMATGVAVISHDCPSGPSTIIRDGYDGILVPSGDVDGLARAIIRVLQNEHERQTLATHATEVRRRYAADAICRQWEELLAAA